jgi:hypothetical protein
MSAEIERNDMSHYKISQLSAAQFSNGQTSTNSQVTPPNMFQKRDMSMPSKAEAKKGTKDDVTEEVKFLMEIKKTPDRVGTPKDAY